jgi:hypothetical protein
MEEGDINGVKQRSIDPGYEILQVFTDPFEQKYRVRAGRTVRVGGGGRRLSRWGRDRGDSNPMERCPRLAIPARAVTIASGEMYPE